MVFGPRKWRLQSIQCCYTDAEHTAVNQDLNGIAGFPDNSNMGLVLPHLKCHLKMHLVLESQTGFCFVNVISYVQKNVNAKFINGSA